jgi:AcrR family transcriptional regulator
VKITLTVKPQLYSTSMTADESMPVGLGLWRTPVQKRSRAVVKRIVEATRELLNEGPLEELTMQGAAQRAGVSVGTLYRYFADKGDLVRVVQDWALEELEGSLLTHLSEAQPTAESIVSALVAGFDEVTSKRGREFCAFLVQGPPDPALALRGRSTFSRCLAAFHGVLARDRGRIAHQDLGQAARIAFEIVNGLFFWYARSQHSMLKLDEDSPSRAVVTNGARRAALAYLLQPEPTSGR